MPVLQWVLPPHPALEGGGGVPHLHLTDGQGAVHGQHQHQQTHHQPHGGGALVHQHTTTYIAAPATWRVTLRAKRTSGYIPEINFLECFFFLQIL